ncbi:MAG: hypothetical protein ACI4QN_06370 [Candidatus Coproplasma sp.]
MFTSLLAVSSFETWQIVLLAFGYAATLAAIIGVGVLLVRSGNKSSTKNKPRKVVVQPTQQAVRPAATAATPIVVQLPQQPTAQKSAQQTAAQQPVVQTVPVMVQPQQPTVITQVPYVQPMMQMPYVQPMMQMPMAQPMVMPYYMPMAQQPVVQQPIVQQPTVQQPVAQQQPAAQQQPVAQQPAPAPAPTPEPEIRRGMSENDERVYDVFGFYSAVENEPVSTGRSRETTKRRVN